MPAGGRWCGDQRGNVDFIDELAEECRFGEDLDVEELGNRLKRNLRERVESVEPAGRMDVDDRDGKHESPRDPVSPAPGALGERNAPPADHVVAMVERRNKRDEVRSRPR